MEKRNLAWLRVGVLLIFALLAGGLGYQQNKQQRWEAWKERALRAKISTLPSLWARLPVSEDVLFEAMRARFLKAPQPERLRVAWFLGRSGRLDLAWLREHLRHKDWKVREAVVFALGRMPTPRKEEVALLGEALQDEQAFVRFRAVHGLKRFGAMGRSFLPRLYAELQDGAPTAADLHSHDPNDPHSHSAHEHHLDPKKQKGFFCGKPPDPGWEVRYAILQELPHLESQRRQQAQWYRLALADKDKRVQRWATHSLQRLGKDAYEPLMEGLSVGTLRQKEHIISYLLTVQKEDFLKALLKRWMHPVSQVWLPVADLLSEWLAKHRDPLEDAEKAQLSSSFCNVLRRGDAQKLRFLLRALSKVSLSLPCVIPLFESKGKGSSMALQVITLQLEELAKEAPIPLWCPHLSLREAASRPSTYPSIRQSLPRHRSFSLAAPLLAALWRHRRGLGKETLWALGGSRGLARGWLAPLAKDAWLRQSFPQLWLESLVRVGSNCSQVVNFWWGRLRHASIDERLRLWRLLESLPHLGQAWEQVLSLELRVVRVSEYPAMLEVFRRHPQRLSALKDIVYSMLASDLEEKRIFGAHLLMSVQGKLSHDAIPRLSRMLLLSEREQSAALGPLMRLGVLWPAVQKRLLSYFAQASERKRLLFWRAWLQMADLARSTSSSQDAGALSAAKRVWSVENVGPLLPLLRGSLSARHHLLRKLSLEVIGLLGKSAYSLREAVRGVLRDPSPAVRAAALVALRAMGASPFVQKQKKKKK